MPKLPKSKKTKVAEVAEVVEDTPVVDETPVVDTTADAEPTEGVGNVGNTPMYVDPYSFVYEVQAGKKYQGMNADEAIQFAVSVLGKVDKIVISKMK